MKILIAFVICIGFHSISISQIDTIALKSPEGITNKMLDLISGEIGEERNWPEFRNLFLPTAQFISLRHGKDGMNRSNVMNLEEFVRNVGPLYARDGFEEYEIGVTINEFNGIASVFQSYFCKNLKGTYEKRGINIYDLVFVDNRWWIANTLFANETEEESLPDKYVSEEYRNKD